MQQGQGWARAFRARLADLAEWLFGCSHRRTTFPITLPTVTRQPGADSPETETYVVCLECGRRMAYDWAKMRLTWYEPDGSPHGMPEHSISGSITPGPASGSPGHASVFRSPR